MKLGRIVATATLVAYCQENEIDLMPYIHCYELNDWGVSSSEEQHQNNMDMFNLSGRIIATYELPTGKRFWIVTEWNEQERITTAMFPDDY
ncbi:hypothetical protein KPA96_13595 [Burkholderia cenocepacia]|uniref:hypothetical protein n=1 Tax=Burkholderia cenocepacia TaxID=95486 RepID=UPI00285FDF0A|nr:hypothetical protein [Burkholderia cenocepacia]MCB4346784.1 hypothetical protein [Burkholderia vietnamiensis]MDR8076690.1 hypothetical protein [Burkholderia cenocepacia]